MAGRPFAVTNTTPIISLVGIGQLGLLDDLFERVVVPLAVWTELADKAGAPDTQELAARRGVAPRDEEAARQGGHQAAEKQPFYPPPMRPSSGPKCGGMAAARTAAQAPPLWPHGRCPTRRRRGDARPRPRKQPISRRLAASNTRAERAQCASGQRQLRARTAPTTRPDCANCASGFPGASARLHPGLVRARARARLRIRLRFEARWCSRFPSTT